MTAHADLVAVNAHVIGYVQAADPGAIGTGKIWVDTTNGALNWQVKVRNTANDGWNWAEREQVWVLHNTTANNTPTELFLDGAALRLVIPDDATWYYEVWVTARRTDSDDESAAYVIRACMDRNAGVTAQVGAVSNVWSVEDSGAWNCTATADAANNSLLIQVTGENGKTIYWRAMVHIVEATG